LLDWVWEREKLDSLIDEGHQRIQQLAVDVRQRMEPLVNEAGERVQ
jgi:hypothetical protein